MKQPQLFTRVGRDRYVPIYSLVDGVTLYAWDDEKQRIVPYAPTCVEELRNSEGISYTPTP